MCTANAILQISEEASDADLGSRGEGHKGVPSLFPRLGSRAKTDIAFANPMKQRVRQRCYAKEARDDPRQRAKRLSWLE